MGFRKTVTMAAAAVSMIAAPTLAAAQPSAAKLSVAGARTSATTKGQSKLAPTGVIIGLVALAAVVGGVIIAADNKDKPASA